MQIHSSEWTHLSPSCQGCQLRTFSSCVLAKALPSATVCCFAVSHTHTLPGPNHLQLVVNARVGVNSPGSLSPTAASPQGLESSSAPHGTTCRLSWDGVTALPYVLSFPQELLPHTLTLSKYQSKNLPPKGPTHKIPFSTTLECFHSVFSNHSSENIHRIWILWKWIFSPKVLSQS